MLIEKPTHIPVYVPVLVDEACHAKHYPAALAIIEATGATGADSLSISHPMEWGTMFIGPVPDPDLVVQVAESHGYDVLWGLEVFSPTEWGATFRSVTLRTPESIAAYCQDVLRMEAEHILAEERSPELGAVSNGGTQ